MAKKRANIGDGIFAKTDQEQKNAPVKLRAKVK